MAEFFPLKFICSYALQALSGVCSSVQVDVAKSVLKQGAVQHLYGKLSGQLQAGRTDADLLQALHPTPAVCGRCVLRCGWRVGGWVLLLVARSSSMVAFSLGSRVYISGNCACL